MVADDPLCPPPPLRKTLLKKEKSEKLVGRQAFADYLKISLDTLDRRAQIVDPVHFGIQTRGPWEGWEDQARAWDEVASQEARRHPERRRLTPWRPPEAPGVAGIVGREG